MSDVKTIKTAIVGSGIAGIASAIRLAAKGYTVDVYEANAEPGGKMSQHFSNGYRFDTGPTVITLPHLVNELFVLCGKNPKDYIDFVGLKNPFKYFFTDGSIINGHANLEDFAEELNQKAGVSKVDFKRYLKSAEDKYEITRPVFIESPIHRRKDFLSKPVISGLSKFHRIEAFKTMDSVNRSFFKDERVVAIFNNFASYVGSNSFVAPATLNVIPHLELALGVYMPKNGIYSIVQALVQLAEEIGVKFHFNQYVEEITTSKSRVTGIQVGGRNTAYDMVVSNMDIYFTYKKLMPYAAHPKRILKQEKSNSIIAFYWGINREYPELGIHNMLFSDNQKEEFTAILKRQTIYQDPTLYIGISSKNNADDAPKGKENWFVLMSVPNNQGQDWNKLVEDARKNCIQKIDKMLNTSIEENIEYEKVANPVTIENDYFSALGSVYGNSSNNRFATFFRHANFSKRIKNLYFVGGSVHPGAGVPMCLNSAKILEKVLEPIE